MEKTNLDFTEESDLDKNGNESEVSKGKRQQNALKIKSIKRNLETSDEETDHRPQKKTVPVGERFFWSQTLVEKLLEFLKMDFDKFQNTHLKKKRVFKGIYEKLKPFCDEPGLTVGMVQKKWHNMMDYHRRMREVQEKTGKVRYYQFYDEVDELVEMFQKTKGIGEAVSAEKDVSHLIVVDTNMSHNEVTIPEENAAQLQCSISDITAHLGEESSSDEESDKEERGKCGKAKKKRKRLPNISRAVETGIKDLVSEHQQMVHCELRKTRSIERTCEVKETLSEGIINAINRRNDILERQQSSTYRINDIYTMLQKYECKLENMDTRLLKLESTMYRIESLLEKVVNKLNEKK